LVYLLHLITAVFKDKIYFKPKIYFMKKNFFHIVVVSVVVITGLTSFGSKEYYNTKTALTTKVAPPAWNAWNLTTNAIIRRVIIPSCNYNQLVNVLPGQYKPLATYSCSYTYAQEVTIGITGYFNWVRIEDYYGGNILDFQSYNVNNTSYVFYNVSSPNGFVIIVE
jgi:hypothetical protein